MRRAGAYLLLASLLLAQSCGKTLQDEVVASDSEIRFSVCSPVSASVETRSASAFPGNSDFKTLADAGIGLSAAFLPSGNFSAESVPSNYFTNRQLKRQGYRSIGSAMALRPAGLDYNEWLIEPSALWPYVGKLSFFAYAPYQETFGSNLVVPGFVTSFTGVEEGETDWRAELFTPYISGFPRLFFRPEVDPLQQIDLLTSMKLNQELELTQSNYLSNKTYVDLDLSHSLTWVDFQARVVINPEDFTTGGGTQKENWDAWLAENNLTGCKIFVAGIKLNDVLGANYGRWTAGGFVWDTPADMAAAEKATYTLSIEDGTLYGPDIEVSQEFWSDLRYNDDLSSADYIPVVMKTSDVTDYKNPDGALYLLPHTLPAGANLTVNFGMFMSREVPVLDEEGNQLMENDVPVTTTEWEPRLMYQKEFAINGNSWLPGAHVIYKLSLNITKASSSTVEAVMVDWTDAGNQYNYSGKDHDYLE